MPGTSNLSRWALPATAVVLLGTSLYGLVGLSHERRQTRELSAANQSLQLSLRQMQDQMRSLSDRLNDANQVALASAPPTQTDHSSPFVDSAASERPTVIVHVKPERRAGKKTRAAAITRPNPPRDDPRWNVLQSRLNDQQQQLNSNKEAIDQARQDMEGKLSSQHDELSGAIARNHDELAALQKRGERNYYEFEIDKSKNFQKIGPVSVSLRKANQKHEYYDLKVLIDDQQIEKKHLNLYEPLVLNTSSSPQTIELVVNEIHGNSIKGYISEPKYKDQALTASAEEPPKTLQQR